MKSPFADKVLMVRPASFGFNPETADSNAFQRTIDLAADEIGRRAVAEFDAMASGLREAGIEVVVAEDAPEPMTSDAVFPNNWFSTHPGGVLVLYPMESEMRRRERDARIIDLICSETGNETVVDLSGPESEGRFLEGTGSLIIDRSNGRVFACGSSRTDRRLAEEWAERFGLELVYFHAFDRNGTPVYHTNVLLCIGSGFAVVCEEAIDPAERESVIEALRAGSRDVVAITHLQMEEFAGNMLQLRSAGGRNVLAMSSRARNSLTAAQFAAIEAHTDVVSFDIPTIETCGGGSVRCMLAELFE